jgi:hypothetical protein
MKMNKTKCILLAGALLLSACGDPEKAAQTTIDEVQANLQKEQVDYDPQHRLDAYESMINEVESIAKEAKTSVGRTIAAGQSVNGVSLAGLQRLHDALAPRAGCYADPTVDCLAPFGSSATNGRAAASPENAFADAEKLVCDKGFSSADKALDPFKINKQAYAKELIQVALSATQCDNPGEVKAAIDAYLKATPEQSGERLSGLLSILNTPALKPA